MSPRHFSPSSICGGPELPTTPFFVHYKRRMIHFRIADHPRVAVAGGRVGKLNSLQVLNSYRRSEHSVVVFNHTLRACPPARFGAGLSMRVHNYLNCGTSDYEYN